MKYLKTDSKPEQIIQQIEDILREAGITLEFSSLHLHKDEQIFQLVDKEDKDSGDYGFYGGQLPRTFDSEVFKLVE